MQKTDYGPYWTIDRAKEELPDWQSFVNSSCNYCNSEWYCPTLCILLEKAQTLDFSLIQQAYFRNAGDLSKVWRYIRRKYKIEQEKKENVRRYL